METLECIAKRASIRKYAKKAMKDDDIKAILRAGMEAPSAMGRRPYELIVNTENDFWKEFVEEKPTCEIMRNAALTVVVLGDANKNPTEEYLIEDCSCLAENMLLAATDLGYGSLWAGVKRGGDFAKKITDYFHLPAGLVPIAVLLFGVPEERKTQPDRFDEKKIHWGAF